MSVMDRALNQTPVAVLDFETTGLSPKTGARVVEIGVVRVEPGGDPHVVLDTLVDPEGPVHASDIHGITDDDVVGAPQFRELAGTIYEALDGAVVLAYNSAFDMGFLKAELLRACRLKDCEMPPHLCLMWLRPLLGLGGRASLCATCEDFGLPTATHTAADDATVSAYLWLKYREHAAAAGLRTFADLSAKGTHKYLKTLVNVPYSRQSGLAVFAAPATVSLKARTGRVAFTSSLATPTTATLNTSALLEQAFRALNEHFGSPPIAARRRAYWQSMVAMLGDRALDAGEIDSLRDERVRLELGETDVRALHSRYVGQRLLHMVEDHSIDAHESGELSRLYLAMRRLGWAPGD
jgi:DNA polymerase-3 subunit epsilon